MDAPAVTVVLRPYQPDDAPFLFSTWRNSSFYGKEAAQAMPGLPKAWFREKTRSIRHILNSAQVTMAVLAGDPTHLVGYSVITGKHLDWVYVKADYRKQGIARLLVPQWIETVTSDMTKIGKAIREAKQLSLKEEPFKSQEEMDATIATYKRLERHATLPDIMWCSEASARKLCKDAGLSQAQEDAFIEAHVIKENKEDE